ncbi:odorant receptor 42a isoform X1 [Episyrphus balteatus]|uniref:odorant receptor 42a isoform X1 n=1 Tax=Episyrphus balteatus TaxID=286459 RepID=UPI00248631BB|nr:odorant receptor 42a isoform X1 [Episyrphus balteatus]
MVETYFKPISTQDATTYLYKVFRILGMDNLNRTWVYKIYSFVLNLASSVLLMIAFSTSYAKSIRTMSTPTLLTSLQVALNIDTICIKVLIVYFYMPRIRKTGPILDELDKMISDKEEKLVASRMIRFCKSLIVVYMVSNLSYAATTFLASVWSGHPPLGIFIPYCHWEDSTVKMIVASLIEYYLLNVACIQNVGLDVYPVTFIYMARMHMKILCIRVEKLGTDSRISKEDNVRKLVECIETHKKILELIETVRPIIAKTIFIQLVVSALIMGIPIINIMMFADSLSSAFGSLIFLLAVTLETLPMCFTMNVLMEEINNLPTAIFHSQWVDQNKVFRNMLVLFMQKAQKFDNIMAGNILPIEVATFIAIAKLAFSIYAVVDKMADRRSALATLGQNA